MTAFVRDLDLGLQDEGLTSISSRLQLEPVEEGGSFLSGSCVFPSGREQHPAPGHVSPCMQDIYIISCKPMVRLSSSEYTGYVPTHEDWLEDRMDVDGINEIVNQSLGHCQWPSPALAIQRLSKAHGPESSEVRKLRESPFGVKVLSVILVPDLAKAGELSKPCIKAIDKPTATMQRMIGNHGKRRIEQFVAIEDGWDGGRGRAFSKASLGVFDYFLQHKPRFSISTPSVFLTHNGNIQLEWSDLEDNDIEIEFFPDHFEYYLSRLDEEGSLGLEAAPLLVEKIGAVQHSNG